MNKKGFTLIEVMFALFIIGIISALVIPIMRNAFADRIYGAQLKKSASQITTAVQEIIADERGTDTINTDGIEDETDTKKGFYFTSAGVKTSNATQGAQYFLTKYFRHTKICGSNGGCAASKYMNPSHKDLGGIPARFYCIKTANGAAICMRFDTVTRGSGTSKETVGNMKVIVDVNGAEKPNMTGLDTYVMYITNDGHLKDLDENEDNCNKDRSSGTTVLDYAAGCFTKAVNNGWKISE